MACLDYLQRSPGERGGFMSQPESRLSIPDDNRGLGGLLTCHPFVV